MKSVFFLLLLLIMPPAARAQNHVIVTPSDPQPPTAAEAEAAPDTPPIAYPMPLRAPYFLSDFGLTTGANLLARGRYAQAVATFEEVLERNPRNIDALAGIAAAYLGLGRTEPAGDYIRKALARDNRHTGANYLYGIYYVETDQVEQAIDQLTLLNMLCGEKYGCPEAASLEGAINATAKK